MAVMLKAAILARTLVAVAMVAAVALGAPAVAQDAGAPEAGTGWYSGGLATATSHMVAAANPHAVEAGLEILRAGGSAADAAVAVQLVLNLVEPQSSGIGRRRLRHCTGMRRRSASSTYDGRETAPAAAKPATGSSSTASRASSTTRCSAA